MDKKFYIVIPAYSLEMGFTKDNHLKKAQTLLLPRRDQLIRQLNRIGLKSRQLTNVELIETFFNLYNQPILQTHIELAQVVLTTPKATSSPIPQVAPASPTPIPPPSTSIPDAPSFQTPQQSSRSHPFIVEELTDSL